MLYAIRNEILRRFTLQDMKNNDFTGKIRNFIETNSLISKGDTIVAGVSGGADSVCLFKVLDSIREEYNLTLKVVCVDHGLREEAKDEIRYVKSLCESAGVVFLERKADVTGYVGEKGLGTEEAGRILRYEIFRDVADSCDGNNVKIAVAHNKNDVAETVLFNLFRGTGPKGLSSLKPERDGIIRPLLCVERREIEEFLKESKTDYYTDASNLTDDYTRNKIRHHILEYAQKEINEGSVSHIAEAAGLFGELNDFVEKEAEKRMKKILVSSSSDEVILKRKGLSEEDPYISKILIKKCIDMLVPHNKDITASHLRQVREISEKEMKAETCLPYGIRVVATQDLVRFSRGEEKEEAFCFDINGETGTIRIPGVGTLSWKVEDKKEDFVVFEKQYTKCFDYDKITECLRLRNPQKGDFLTVNEALQKKKLSDYFINEKIPSFDREKQLVLADGNHIWWVIGRRISQYPKITEATKRILYIFLED